MLDWTCCTAMQSTAFVSVFVLFRVLFCIANSYNSAPCIHLHSHILLLLLRLVDDSTVTIYFFHWFFHTNERTNERTNKQTNVDDFHFEILLLLYWHWNHEYNCGCDDDDDDTDDSFNHSFNHSFIHSSSKHSRSSWKTWSIPPRAAPREKPDSSTGPSNSTIQN